MENNETTEDRSGREGPEPEAERDAVQAAPTPVRAAMTGAPAANPDSGESAAPEPGVTRAQAAPELELEGVRWTVRVLGRSGSGIAHVPLLLLGFFHPEDAGAPRREAWVVARDLGALSEAQLERAWQSSAPCSSGGERSPFFPEIAARGAKEG